MLNEKIKNEVIEMVSIMKKLDDTGRMLMLNNAVVLLARQEISKQYQAS